MFTLLAERRRSVFPVSTYILDKDPGIKITTTNTMLRRNRQLGVFLAVFLGFTISTTLGKSISSINYRNDPNWFSNINYSDLVSDMVESLQTTKQKQAWFDNLSDLLDLPLVYKEFSSPSTAEKEVCTACRFFVNFAREMFKSGLSDEKILDYFVEYCVTTKLRPTRMCKGHRDRQFTDIINVVRDSDMTDSRICNYHFQYEKCPTGNDPRHDWHVTFPPAAKPGVHPTKPPSDSSPTIKVLQLSDVHHDPYYTIGSNADCGESLCCRESHGVPKDPKKAAKKWGDYRKCDPPTHTVEHAFKHIVETHKDIDYIMWTGDIPTHDGWNQTREGNLEYYRISMDLMEKYFPDIPIYPSVGNHESCPGDSFVPDFGIPSKNMSWLYHPLDRYWSRWLPSSASETVRRGAYYSVLVKPGLRILSINGNYCHKNNWWLLKNSTDPTGQLAWMIRELDQAEANGEKVHIIGHVPPGDTDCMKAWSRNYYEIINRYEAIIMAQYYGHTHYDEFEVFYDTNGYQRPISVGYIAPSLTPWLNVNPAYRIYHIDGDHEETTRAIVDHETWSMDLVKANNDDNPVYKKLYTAREAFNMSSLMPKDWDDLINRMKKDSKLFEKYHRFYYRDSGTRPKCYANCRKKLLCNMRSGKSYENDNLCRGI